MVHTEFDNGVPTRSPIFGLDTEDTLQIVLVGAGVESDLRLPEDTYLASSSLSSVNSIFWEIIGFLKTEFS